MTVLSVTREACTQGIALEQPTLLIGSTTREVVELAGLVQDVADMIARSFEWQKLNAIATITGDGATEDFDLPADYDRMLKKSQLWSSSLETPLSPISGRDKWLGLDVQSFDFVINAWIIYGGQVHVKPALATGVTAKYWYQSNKKVVATDGTTTKASFTADSDVFRLDEQLLKYGLIWRWRSMKGLPYAEDLATYGRRLEQLASDDKGSRMIRIGRSRFSQDLTVAYPQSITG